MDIIIQSKGFTAGAELEGFISEKLQKLDKMSDNIIRARVTLHEGQESVDNKHCDIRLEVPGNDHLVSKSGGAYEAAALAAVDTLQDILRRAKDK
ncbi:MAG: HPF/RaiA family ribosome-associated protein [Chitinophagales bacterium]|nr:HPF/RaiA family ribosome-associated protein [Chitinophagaceae bacterium]MCB9064738.1 HPF/RaiA family ribosome-associated protein [Chitinophagales bacterium]